VSLAEPGTLFSGGHRLNHGLNDNQEMERVYADWVEDCESESFKIHNEEFQKWSDRTENGKKFVDIDFDIEAEVNFGDKKTNTWVRITDSSWGKKGKLVNEAAFIKDGIDAFDISQGRIGNCWFLSSISALAQKRKLIKRVLMPQYNNQPEAGEGGIYRFRFYHMGEWMDIIIDDQLPKRYAAKPTDGEFWVPLLEKAYAKFFGGYKNTIGGDPTWALCNLTGGICLEIANDQFNTDAIERMALPESQGGNAFDLFEFLKRIQNEAVFATSNTENSGEDATQHAVGQMGLVAGHAYAMLKVANVRFNNSSSSEDGEKDYKPGDVQRIVQIRNPWASGEWLGNWHDGDKNWDAIDAADKEKYHSNDDDGCFWMSWEDWTTEFETLDICYMPDEEKGKNHRVIGDFMAGGNAPTGLSQLSKSYLKPELTHQIEVIVGPNCDLNKKGVKAGRTEVYFQFLIDCSVREPHYLAFNLFTDLKDHDEEYTRKELKASTHVEPVLPLKKGFQIDYYRHNGFIYHLEPNRRYVLVISAAPKKTQTTDKDGTEFMLRAIGDDLIIQHQTDI